MNFSPAIYEHCARFTNHSPWEVSRDADLLFSAQVAAHRRYRHNPVVVGVDIYNLEAEALGAVVCRPEGNGIPAIVEHLLPSVAAIGELPGFDVHAGRIPMVLEVARWVQTELPEADVRVPVSGPFSIASNLVGFDVLLMGLVLEPETTARALLHLVEGQLVFCRAIRDAGLDVAFFESAATPPLLSPALFAEVELPALRAVIAGAEEIVGHPVPCVMGGDTTPILPDILSTGTRYVICPASGETDQQKFMEIMEAHPEVMVRVNMAPEITARGCWEEVRAETDRIAALVGDREKVCLGTGALPFETAPETIDRIGEYSRGL